MPPQAPEGLGIDGGEHVGTLNRHGLTCSLPRRNRRFHATNPITQLVELFCYAVHIDGSNRNIMPASRDVAVA